jgi:hypothetical protein
MESDIKVRVAMHRLVYTPSGRISPRALCAKSMHEVSTTVVILSSANLDQAWKKIRSAW